MCHGNNAEECRCAANGKHGCTAAAAKEPTCPDGRPPQMTRAGPMLWILGRAAPTRCNLQGSGETTGEHANGQLDFVWLPARTMRHTPVLALGTCGA